MTLMMQSAVWMFSCFKADSVSERLQNRQGLVELFTAASAFHKKLMTSHECAGMSDSEGLDSVS